MTDTSRQPESLDTGLPADDYTAVKRFVRDLPIALLIGLLIGVIVWLTDRSVPFLPLIVASCWIGICIFVTIFALLNLSWGLLGRLRGWRQKLVLGPLFFVASAAGYFLGVKTVSWVTAGRIALRTPDWGGSLAIAGGIGVVLGLSMVSYELLKNRLKASLERIKEQEIAEKELETARQIQSRLLPPSELDGPGYRIAARNEPARYVAGDFYDVLHLESGGGLGLAIADVSGKGVGASLVMASVKTALTLLAPERSVAETMGELNRRLAEELGPRQFVALAFARFDPGTGTCEIANAGMPDPYLLSAGQPPRALCVDKPRLPLGLKPELEYRTLTARLEEDEALLFVSDGLPEAPAESDEPLGYESLESLLLWDGGPPREWLDRLFAAVEERTTGEREDDWTALLVERR